jgi:hypothetical protein
MIQGTYLVMRDFKQEMGEKTLAISKDRTVNGLERDRRVPADGGANVKEIPLMQPAPSPVDRETYLAQLKAAKLG